MYADCMVEWSLISEIISCRSIVIYLLSYLFLNLLLFLKWSKNNSTKSRALKKP